jgi:thioredoxin 1
MSKLIVKKFYGEWCSPCKVLAPMFEQVKETYKGNDDIIFENIDVDKNYELASNYAVRSIPLVIIERDGKEIQRFSGVQSVLAYRNAINENLN